MGSFCRLPGTSGYFPCPLSALEEHNFLFQLRGGEQPPPGAKEVSWCVHISDENSGNRKYSSVGRGLAYQAQDPGFCPQRCINQ